MIEVLIVVVIILLVARFSVFQKTKTGPLGFSRLKPEHKAFLAKHFRFYGGLPKKSKQLFERRVAYFMQAKTFVPRQMIDVSWEMKVLISASAIQLTFGFPKIHLSYFKYILVYPDSFFSQATQTHNQGEVNPREKAIVIGWRYFVEGYLKADGRNLGLHEMAHALRLENRIMNREYNFLDQTALREWEIRATNTMLEIEKGIESFFREYGATNREEFFAVAVENFFERPDAFSEKHPLTYEVMCRLLRQNPKLLNA